MRNGRSAIALLFMLILAGCPLDGDEQPEQTPDAGVTSPIDASVTLAKSCELSTECGEGEYCLDGACDRQPTDLDDEPGYPGLQTHAGACRLVMKDDYNDTETTLQVEQLNDVLFVITDDVGGSHPWSVEAVLYADGELDFAAGVPRVDYEELLEEYELEDMDVLSFDSVDGFTCSDFDRSLIFFLVMEWFYFG